MATNPEARARLSIDALLNAAGWAVQDAAAAHIHASRASLRAGETMLMA